MTKTDLTLTVVQAHPTGVTSLTVAILLCRNGDRMFAGCSQATAAGILARLFWRGLVDRRKVGLAYVYTPRAPRV